MLPADGKPGDEGTDKKVPFTASPLSMVTKTQSKEVEAKDEQNDKITVTTESTELINNKNEDVKHLEAACKIIGNLNSESNIGGNQDDDIAKKDDQVAEPAFKENTIDTVESVQDIQDGIIDAAKYVVKSVVDKIEKEIEVNVEKEERKGIIEQDATLKERIVVKDHTIESAKYRDKNETVDQVDNGTEKKPVFEPAFVEEHIEPLGSIKDVKDDIIDAAKSVVQKVADKIETKIAQQVEKEESKDIIFDKSGETIETAVNQTSIDTERKPVYEPEFVQEHIEPLGSIVDVKDDIIDAAKSVVEKVAEKIETKIEEKVEEEENKNIMVPEIVNEKENEYTKPLETMQEAQDGIVDITKSLIEKVKEKIDNKIEQNVEEEESKNILNDKNALKKEGDIFSVSKSKILPEHKNDPDSVPDLPIDTKSTFENMVEQIEDQIEQKMQNNKSKEIIDTANVVESNQSIGSENRSPVQEPAFIQEDIETLESIHDVKDDLIKTAKSDVQKVITKIDNEITSKVEDAERKEVIKEPVNEPAFQKEIIEPVEAMNSIKTDKSSEEEEVIVNKENDNLKQQAEIASTEDETVHNTENMEKLKAPSFTQLRVDSVKEEKSRDLHSKTTDDPDLSPTQEANSEDYYWITVGSFLIAIVAVVGSVLYYYFNQNQKMF